VNPLTRLRQFGQGPRRRRPPRPATRRLRQFGWVAFITLLVWVWADLEQTTSESMNVTIKIVPPRGSDVRVEAPGDEGRTLWVTVRGAQGRITDLVRTLQDAETADTTCVVEADPAWPRTYTLDVLAVLNQWELLQGFNVSVVAADPATLTVKTDRWIPVEAQVRIRTAPDTALHLETDEMPPPPTVKIRIPASRQAQLQGRLLVPTEPIQLSRDWAGQEVTRNVALAQSIDGVPIQFVEEFDGSPKAEVTLRVSERTTSRTLPDPVPVHLLVDPPLMERITREGYVLSRDDSYPEEWQITLTLRGTARRLGQVKAEDILAFVRVNESDLIPTDTHPDRSVEFYLPEGVTVVEPEAPEVHFKYVRQSQ